MNGNCFAYFDRQFMNICDYFCVSSSEKIVRTHIMSTGRLRQRIIKLRDRSLSCSVGRKQFAKTRRTVRRLNDPLTRERAANGNFDELQMKTFRSASRPWICCIYKRAGWMSWVGWSWGGVEAGRRVVWRYAQINEMYRHLVTWPVYRFHTPGRSVRIF